MVRKVKTHGMALADARRVRVKARLFSSLLTAGILGACAWSAEAADYSFTDLGTLGGDKIYSGAYAINNLGQVVGYSWSSGHAADSATLWNGNTATDLGALTGSQHSYAWDINDGGVVVGQSGSYWQSAAKWLGGSVTYLDRPANTDTAYAYGVNNAGTVVGQTLSLGFSENATAWNGTTPTKYNAISGWSGEINAINNAGSMAGASTNSSGSTQATRWDGTTPVALGMAGGSIGRAYDINDAGQVVGWTNTANGDLHAILWNGTTPTDLGTLGGDFSMAFAINELGLAVGKSTLSPGGSTTHAMLWDGTTLIDLNDLLDAAAINDGWILLDAQDINENGWIVGSAYNSKTNVVHAYVLSVGESAAVPEPGTGALILLALGLLVVAARRGGGRQAVF